MAHSSWLRHLRVVPGFCIAVEELRRPELRIRPVIIGVLPHQRGTVREANILAQRSGVHPDMALSQAYQQCPDGVFLLPDPSRYEAVWEAVCNILRTYTPLVESIEMGQAVCDLSGCERQWGDGRSAAYAITRQIQCEKLDGAVEAVHALHRDGITRAAALRHRPTVRRTLIWKTGSGRAVHGHVVEVRPAAEVEPRRVVLVREPQPVVLPFRRDVRERADRRARNASERR